MFFVNIFLDFWRIYVDLGFKVNNLIGVNLFRNNIKSGMIRGFFSRWELGFGEESC